MKILMLSNAASIHTKRWVKSLSERGYDICLFSLNTDDDPFYSPLKNVKLVHYHYRYVADSFFHALMQRMEFFSVVKQVKQLVKSFQPDLMHAHYVVDYGSLGVASGFHPLVLSVWGSDVYGEKTLSRLSQLSLKYKLRRTDCILSTSAAMARETAKYTSKEILITPFGVDVHRFAPNVSERNEQEPFVVGTVKSLEPIYGIDTLINAFKITVDNNPEVPLVLQIVGVGSQKAALEQLVSDLDLRDRVTFVGKVPNEELPTYYNRFDVAVNLSLKESFGVVAVEAMACGCPVVASDADGFKEVIEDGKTGFIVPKQNPKAASEAIQRFIDHRGLRSEMGANGRQRALSLYDWEKNVDTMTAIYSKLLQNAQ